VAKTSVKVVPVQPAQPALQADEICLKARQAADSQKWDEALSLLDTLLKSHPLHEYAHYLRGLIYMEQRNFGKALSALRQALYCNSNFILARYTLGELYTQMGHPTQAVKEWRFAQHLLTPLSPESLVPHSADLSVDMLNGLLEMHLRNGGLKA
jgi:tetratricopeptide (TPR) repeat protein